MHFSLHELPIYSPSNRKKVIRPIFTNLYELALDTNLIHLLSDINTFANTLDSIHEKTKLDPLDFSEQCFELLYRLLDFAPLKRIRSSYWIENILHLALLSIMTASLPTYTTTLRYELLAERLAESFQECLPTTIVTWKLVLWALFVSRVSVLHSEHDFWVLPLIRSASSYLEISSWTQTLQVLQEYCWIHALYDQIAKDVWHQAYQIKTGTEVYIGYQFPRDI